MPDTVQDPARHDPAVSVGPGPLHPACVACGAFQGCLTPFIGTRGTNLHNPDVLYIGEAPGREEDESGQPFVGEAGKILQGQIDQAKVASYAIVNAVRCRPPNNKLRGHEIEACRPHLIAEISRLKPKLLVLQGNSALKAVLDTTGIMRLRGVVTDWVAPDGAKYTVLPTVHPASTLYHDGAEKKRMYSEDMQAVPQVLAAAANPQDHTSRRRQLRTREQVEQALREAAACKLVAFDTETGAPGCGGLNPWAGNKILCLSWCWRVDYAVVVPVDHPESCFVGEDRAWLKARLREFFLTHGLRLVGLHAKFDIEHLVVDLFDSDLPFAHEVIDRLWSDCMLASQTLDENQPRSLAFQARMVTDMTKYDSGLDSYIRAHREELDIRHNGFWRIPWAELWSYSCDDALATFKIWLAREQQLVAQGFIAADGSGFFHDHYMRILHLTIRMRLYGAKVNRAQIDVNEEHYEQEMQSALAELRDNDYVVLTEASFAQEVLAAKPKVAQELYDWCRDHPEHYQFLHGKAPEGPLQWAYILVFAERLYGVCAAKADLWRMKPSSAKKMVRLLFELGGCPVEFRTKKGAPACHKLAIKWLADSELTPADIRTLLVQPKLDEHGQPMLDKAGKPEFQPGPLVRFKVAKKIQSTYVIPYRDLLDERDFMRTSFLMGGGSAKGGDDGGTRTGRLSSENPNLQNLPHDPRITRCFVSRFEGGFILQGDYAQLELRIIGALSGDANIKAAFLSGKDPHSYTVHLLFGTPIEQVKKDSYERRFCKELGFGIVYGMGPVKLGAKVGASVEEAVAMIRRWLGAYPGIEAYIERTKKEAIQNGYVMNPFGRRRWVREAQQTVDEELLSYALRIAVNSPIQGGGADVCLIAAYRLDNYIRANGLQSRIIIQVHDSILIDIHPDEYHILLPIAKKCMERPYAWLNGIPLKTDWKVGRSWGDFTEDLTKIAPKRGMTFGAETAAGSIAEVTPEPPPAPLVSAPSGVLEVPLAVFAEDEEQDEDDTGTEQGH